MIKTHDKHDFYKCEKCKVRFSLSECNGKCPRCNSDENIIQLCEKDTLICDHGVVGNIAFCDVCGEPICPICGCHNVTQISRVTGYLSDVGAWNKGKKQELKDRVRYNSL